MLNSDSMLLLYIRNEGGKKVGKKKFKKNPPAALHRHICVPVCGFSCNMLGSGTKQLPKSLRASLPGAGELSQGLSCLPQSFWAGPLRSCDPACVPRGLEIQAFWIEIKKGPALMDRIDLLLTSSSLSIFFSMRHRQWQFKTYEVTKNTDLQLRECKSWQSPWFLWPQFLHL